MLSTADRKVVCRVFGRRSRPRERGRTPRGIRPRKRASWKGAYRSSRLFFWRTRAGVEVDFVVYGENAFCAFEVKNTSTIRAHDLRSLRTFTSDYPECQAALLYRGRDRLRIDGVWCVPVEDFLRSIEPSRGLFDWIVGQPERCG